MYGLNHATGHLDTEWIERQARPMGNIEVQGLLNPHLAPVGPVQITNVWIPSGAFVTYVPTGPDSSVAHSGGYYYRPSMHAFGSTTLPGDNLDDLQASVLYRSEGLWSRVALCGLTMSANNPIDLYDQKDMSYYIINTGADPLHSGDAFVVEPPSVEASKAQLESFRTSLRAEGNFKNKTLLGGLPATVRVPAEQTERMKHIMTRDIGLCMDVAAPGATGTQAGIQRLYNSPTELGSAVKNTVMAATLDACDSVSVLLQMMRRVAKMPRQLQDKLSEYYNYRQGKGQLNPETLVEIWKYPEMADLFMDSMEFGTKSINRLKTCSFGSVIRFTEANPTPIRGETMYNAYGGQYLCGESFYGTMHSFNGM
ncbi:putative capsid triplex subunit 2 [Cyprinid herpesvirus 1]|uniref:Intercapsomeric triplex protein n=1 Tax=Cyprinid herpesvirus 1 TaxID=317858 RepID=Q52UP2_9VIRU|nr:putative capsid triplex subunit 2 [Cyprinid herpesvirus 1]AAX53080.1 intercapsomeric triplex protein [Cyprinid herpesvirus 1]AFJ20369.1 putative capsid triplex subunit 2 [Cyprinid herpesvirus 1]